jgi:hypothetical protein
VTELNNDYTDGWPFRNVSPFSATEGLRNAITVFLGAVTRSDLFSTGNEVNQTITGRCTPLGSFVSAALLSGSDEGAAYNYKLTTSSSTVLLTMRGCAFLDCGLLNAWLAASSSD